VNAPAFDQILRRLTEAEVRFVVIGGLALGAWGVVRGTKDVDIVVAPDADNVKRLAAVAEEIHGHVHAGESFLSSQLSIAGQVAGGEQVAIETDLGRLDIVQGLDGIPPYDELHARSTKAEILGVEVAVCSIEDLKAMKRAAGRTRDLADLEDLDAASE
jgi:predicted nucleotidyltransferase